jgi:hypothetical protein
MSLQEFNTNPLKENIAILQKFSGKYIMNHKDVDPQFIGNADNALQNLVNQQIITQLTGNDYFDLYEINQIYLTPIINGIRGLSFYKLNPTKYKFQITLRNETEYLHFHQAFNPQREIYLDKNHSYPRIENPTTYSNDIKE